MPNRYTFRVKPINEFLIKYLNRSRVSIDPFCGEDKRATHKNDLRESGITAEEFLKKLISDGVHADLIIFDPPYTLRQAKECYESAGIWGFEHTKNCGGWYKEKKLCDELLIPGGYFLHFGYHSNGIGKKYGFSIEEILLVAHGRAHYDTICMAEIKKRMYLLP